VVGALAGSQVAKALDGQKLLARFGVVMIVVGSMMLRKRQSRENDDAHLIAESAKEQLPLLLGIGFAVGVFSGLFGIGGGFLPSLILTTGMPQTSAIGTSLLAITAFGAATAASYAWSGFVDWAVAALFVLGGLAGGVAGMRAGQVLAESKRTLNIVFASIVIAVGVYVTVRGLTFLVTT
jgi:uncharacterized membrane protein YfcA